MRCLLSLSEEERFRLPACLGVLRSGCLAKPGRKMKGKNALAHLSVFGTFSTFGAPYSVNGVIFTALISSKIRISKTSVCKRNKYCWKWINLSFFLCLFSFYFGIESAAVPLPRLAKLRETSCCTVLARSISILHTVLHPHAHTSAACGQNVQIELSAETVCSQKQKPAARPFIRLFFILYTALQAYQCVYLLKWCASVLCMFLLGLCFQCILKKIAVGVRDSFNP